MIVYTFSCANEACSKFGVIHTAQYEGEMQTAFCGPCGQEITNSERAN